MLSATLRAHGLEPGGFTGLGPRTAKARVLLELIRAKRGRISYGELSRRMDAGPVKDTRTSSYLGYATRT